MMYIRSILALVVFGFGIFVPTLSDKISDESESKIYVARNITTIGNEKVWIGLELPIRDKKGEPKSAVFKCTQNEWSELFNKFMLSGKKVTTFNNIRGFPVAGLFKIVQTYPEFYSQSLPYLLDVSSPKEIADSLDSYLLMQLTSEAKKEIRPSDLAELERLSGLQN